MRCVAELNAAFRIVFREIIKKICHPPSEKAKRNQKLNPFTIVLFKDVKRRVMTLHFFFNAQILRVDTLFFPLIKRKVKKNNNNLGIGQILRPNFTISEAYSASRSNSS